MTRYARSGNSQKHQRMPGDATPWEEMAPSQLVRFNPPSKPEGVMIRNSKSQKQKLQQNSFTSSVTKPNVDSLISKKSTNSSTNVNQRRDISAKSTPEEQIVRGNPSKNADKGPWSFDKVKGKSERNRKRKMGKSFEADLKSHKKQKLNKTGNQDANKQTSASNEEEEKMLGHTSLKNQPESSTENPLSSSQRRRARVKKLQAASKEGSENSERGDDSANDVGVEDIQNAASLLNASYQSKAQLKAKKSLNILPKKMQCDSEQGKGNLAKYESAKVIQHETLQSDVKFLSKSQLKKAKRKAKLLHSKMEMDANQLKGKGNDSMKYEETENIQKYSKQENDLVSDEDAEVIQNETSLLDMSYQSKAQLKAKKSQNLLLKKMQPDSEQGKGNSAKDEGTDVEMLQSDDKFQSKSQLKKAKRKAKLMHARLVKDANQPKENDSIQDKKTLNVHKYSEQEDNLVSDEGAEVIHNETSPEKKSLSKAQLWKAKKKEMLLQKRMQQKMQKEANQSEENDSPKHANVEDVKKESFLEQSALSKHQHKKKKKDKSGKNQQNENKTDTTGEQDVSPSEKDFLGKKKLFLQKLQKKRAENGIMLLPSKVERKLYLIKKRLREKGFSSEMIKTIIRKERRQQENSFKHTFTDKPCFNCRQKGHLLANCPEAVNNKSPASSICFKCGSADHSSVRCNKNVKGYPFAKCFVCKEQGHLSRDCPKNEHGIYINGGKCTLCGNVNHLRKDCPSLNRKHQDEDFIAGHKFSEGMSLDAEVYTYDTGAGKNMVKPKWNKKRGKSVKY